jgi:hypothetical protein
VLRASFIALRTLLNQLAEVNEDKLAEFLPKQQAELTNLAHKAIHQEVCSPTRVLAARNPITSFCFLSNLAIKLPICVTVIWQINREFYLSTCKIRKEMKTKPSDAIGIKTIQNVGKSEVDFNKHWNNGHKVFTAQQARAYAQLLRREECTRVRFNVLKTELVKPRNPLNGEHTPRDGKGAIVMNPKLFFTIKNGESLLGHFDEGKPSAASSSIMLRTKRSKLPGKIGVSESSYEVLGNAGLGLTSSQPEDLFLVTKHANRQKIQQMEEQAKISEYVAKEKAKRYQKDLAREIQYMQQQMEETSQKLQLLQKKFDI